jgi:alanyl-tRNA synthetase
VLSGQIAFKLYDTFGFPADLTETILREQNLTLDSSGYQEAMEKQKQNSRVNSQFKAQLPDTKIFFDIKQKFGETKFLGYEQLKLTTKVVAVIEQEKYKIFVAEQTPFYAESGGQVADQGFVKSKNGESFDILDVQSPIEGLTIHYTDPTLQLKVGDVIELQVNESTRQLTTKNHSATHLLQAALIKTLGTHVKQSGSSVHPDRLRFDFTHTEAVKKLELEKIENMVNLAINQGLAVQCQSMSKDEAVKKGAMALFGEKYGEVVRVISMGDFSTELCGGTHVANTKDIQLFTILSESSLSSGVRRIEATTSENALKHLKQRSQALAELEILLSSNEAQLKTKIQNLMEDLKTKHKELESFKQKTQIQNAASLFDKSEKIKNIEFYHVTAPSSDSDLRTLSDVFLQQKPNGVLYILKKEDAKISFILRAQKNTTYDFTKLAKKLTTLGARAGGKNDMIQGSFPQEHSATVFADIKTFLSELV